MENAKFIMKENTPKGMLKNLLYCVCLFFITACTLQDEVITTATSAKLSFSTDTIAFDTIFTLTKSTVRRLTVYNPNSNAVIVSNIRIGGGANSPFSLVINGKTLNEQNNLRILGKDSILILVTTKLPESRKDLPLFVVDSLLFTTNSNLQNVKLTAWGQDVTLLKSADITQPTVWRKGSKPFLVADSLRILPTGTLTIEEGVTVYMASGALIKVAGKLNIQGSAEKPVQVLGVRNDGRFADLVGQWGGILFTEKSLGADINYAEIRNGVIGLYVGIPDNDTIPDVVVRNTKIQNMLNSGIWAATSDIVLENVLMTNCLEHLFKAEIGGYYRLQHCTLVNYRSVIRQQPAVLLTNFLRFEDSRGQIQTLEAPLQAILQNNIIWGDNEEELSILGISSSQAVALVQKNMIRTTTKTSFGTSNLESQDRIFPKFKSLFKNDYSLDKQSPAINAGLRLGIKTDILGKKRDEQPDLGAYELQ